VGIVATGWIAEKAAITLNGPEGFQCYAVASCSQEKADAFAARWGVEKAYGSYSAMLEDKNIDLVYIGTPHSHHYDITREALEKGFPCLVEKAFMANRKEAQAIVDLTRSRKVFLAEAIWTRYQPVVEMVRTAFSRRS
jgi:predicted dehydrogenase